MKLVFLGTGVFPVMVAVATAVATGSATPPDVAVTVQESYSTVFPAAVSSTPPGVPGVVATTLTAASATPPGIAVTAREKNPNPTVLATTLEALSATPPDVAATVQDNLPTLLPAAVSSMPPGVAGVVTSTLAAVSATPSGVAYTVQEKNTPTVLPAAVASTVPGVAVTVQEENPSTVLPPAVSSSPPGVGVSVQEENTPTALPKTIFSSKMRVVLAVGIGGTGYKYFLRVSRDLFEKNDHLVRLPDISITKYLLRSSAGSNAQYYKFSLRKARTEMRKVAESVADLPLPGTVVFILGKHSYPDEQGPNKMVAKHVDLRLLAEIAEVEGVDFRVVYLRRPVKDIILANTSGRQFQDAIGSRRTIGQEQRFMEYVKFMGTDIAVVHSFLAELNPAYVICHDFEHVGEVEQSDLIADFVAPNADIAKPLKTSLIDVAAEVAHDTSNESFPFDATAVVAHGAFNDSFPFDGAEMVASRLQHKFDTFESRLCTGLH